jgi:hypothetical protein
MPYKKSSTLRRIVVLTAGICLLGLSACDKQLEELVDLSDEMSAAVFVRRQERNAFLCGKLTTGADIRQLIEQITIIERVPATTNTFARHIVFLRGKKRSVSVSFGAVAGDDFRLRYRDREYRIDRRSYESLSACYSQNSKR